MLTVWKSPLPFPASDSVSMMMPVGARILTLQIQGGEPTLWAEVDDTRPVRNRCFTCYGTGHRLPPSPGVYVGTFSRDGFIWHVYEQELEE